MDYIADTESKHKCANEEGRCEVPSAQEYCSDYSSDADDVGSIVRECDCKHTPCAQAKSPRDSSA
jgi:hypothetical protein